MGMTKRLTMREQKAHDDFYLAYGAAIATWSSLEHVLSFWFSYASGMDIYMADCVMSSARSFSAKRDMLIAAFDARRRDEELTKFFRAAMKRTKQFETTRNKLAHDLFIF